MKKVISAKANDNFTLDLQFDDGKLKRFDAKPYLDFPIFSEIKTLETFKQIKIALGTVQWQNEQDISPETLYLEGTEIGQEESVLAIQK